MSAPPKPSELTSRTAGRSFGAAPLLGVLWRREWAMANGETFSVKPIGEMVKRYLEKSSVSCDPFARNKRWATHTNDLNPQTEAEHHLDSITFLEKMVADGVMTDLIIFDPPYSPRQIKECYNSIGLKMGALDAMRTNWMRERDLMTKMQNPGDIVLSFGWNSMGMGKKRGYEIIEGMMVCHGVGHNDTLCMAERKLPDDQMAFAMTPNAPRELPPNGDSREPKTL